MKIVILVSLVLINLIAFLVLGTIYFFRFDLQWGLNKEALTLGLPLLIATIILLACLILIVKRKSWRWGVTGLHFALIALAYHFVFSYGFGVYYLVQPSNGPKETLDTEENRILTAYLEQEVKERSYVILNPRCTLGYVDMDNNDEAENLKKMVKAGLKSQGYDVPNLVDNLFKLNENKEILTIKSLPPDGYYIDYDGKFKRNGNYYSNWLYPDVRGYFEVSIPAYDPESGYILLYKGWVGDVLIGGGGFELLKIGDYFNFVRLAYVVQWVS